MAAKNNAEYGYEAGWMDAREVVYAAMKAEPDSMTLRDLYESMGPEVRAAKVAAYMREVDA
jgi:hypothetical protein